MKKKISIVTPCFNAENFIEETIVSVITQTAILSGKADLEYIICDGNSTDNTVSTIESIKHKYPNEFNCIKIISEPDSGMYHALSKGLQQVSGDIVGYINAGDYYNKNAFDIVLDIFNLGQACWLTGYNVFYNEKSQIIEVKLPFKYRRQFFSCGFYGVQLPSVQQESTFWLSTLNDLIDYDYLSKLKYSGDFYLWLQFSKAYDLKIVKSYLGGFKFHSGQLSSTANNAYYKEKQSMITKPNLFDFLVAFFDRLLWSAPFKIQKRLNNSLFYYDTLLQEWVSNSSKVLSSESSISKTF